MNPSFKISNRIVGEGRRPYVIAEMSANHNGSIEQAKGIIQAAACCGADAIKLQTYRPDTLTIDSKKVIFSFKRDFGLGGRSMNCMNGRIHPGIGTKNYSIVQMLTKLRSLAPHLTAQLLTF